MSAKRKLIVSLFSIVFVVFAVVTTFSIVYGLTEQDIETMIDIGYIAEDIDGSVEATYTVGSVTKPLTPVGTNIDGNKLVFNADDTENAGHFEFPNEIITLTEENDSLIIKYSYSNTGDKHYIASMDFESQFNKNNMIVEYGIIDSSTGVVNYSTNRYAVVVPANSTNKEYYIKVSIDDKTNYASFTASINWILQGCDPQSAEYLTYENLDIQGSDGVYTASYTGGYVHTGELVYPTEINGSPVTTVASNENITSAQKSYIKKVVIPDSVTAIANNAFNGFNHLEEIVFGEEDVVGAQSVSTSSLTTIGEYAFANCERLDELTLPNAVTSVGKNAFENCYNIKQMNISNVATLNEAMFKNCSSLTSIQMIEDVTNFPAEIFSGCTELVDFKFPKIIETIGKSAFKDCSRLVGELDLYFATSIGESAFENCSSFTKVTIGENISTLSINTFAGCENVEGFYLLSHEAITTLSDVNVFNNINNSSKIYVIETLKDEYVADEKWATYSNYFDEIGYTTTGECVDSIEAPVLDMRIYGNSIQNGTPTPETPIEVQSVGDKTLNLFNFPYIKGQVGGVVDYENLTITLPVKENIYILGQSFSGVPTAFEKFNKVLNITEPDYYCLSVNVKSENDNIEPRAIWGLKVTGDNTISPTIVSQSYSNGYLFIKYNITEEVLNGLKNYATSFRLYMYTFRDKSSLTNVETTVNDFMFVKGNYDRDTMPKYEPYGKYKIPVKVNGETTNIYLDEPLRKVGDYADYIDFKTGKVVRNVFESTITINEVYGIYGKCSNVVRFGCYIPDHPKQKKDENMLSVMLPYDQSWTADKESIFHHNTSNVNYYFSFLWSRLGLVYDGTNVYKVDDGGTSITDAEIKNICLDFLNSLSEEYRKIYMILETPTEETIDIPEFSTIAGGTTFEVLTSVQPSQIMVKYHK